MIIHCLNFVAKASINCNYFSNVKSGNFFIKLVIKITSSLLIQTFPFLPTQTSKEVYSLIFLNIYGF